MQKNHATIAVIVVVIAMIAGIMEGVKAGNAAIPVIAFLVCAGLLVLIKRSIETVIEDEWTVLVEQKAANLTLNASTFLFTLVALFLITISSPERNYDQAVYAIAACLITLTVGQVASQIWYMHTLRGTGP